MCLDADTGKVAWEYKFNVYQSDVPPHRVGWASPAADPRDGKHLRARRRRDRRRAEQGRQAALAAIDRRGVGGVHDARRPHHVADHRRRPRDRECRGLELGDHGEPVAAVHRARQTHGRHRLCRHAGRPALRHRLSGAAHRHDQRHAPAHLGERRRRDSTRSSRRPAKGVELHRGEARHQHGRRREGDHGDRVARRREPRLVGARHDRRDRRQPGRRHQADEVGRQGAQFGFSSPLIDGDRVYQIENGSKMRAFDIETGKELWRQDLGTVQKAPPVLADGKIYVGTESGKFFILRPGPTRAEVLSEVELPLSTNSVQQAEGTPEPILAGAAISRGRVFFVSSDAVYAFGPKTAKRLSGWATDEAEVKGEGAPAFLQVTPTELVLKPGQTVKLHARLFDDDGRFLREDDKATWSLDGLKGSVTDGTFVVASEPEEQAGLDQGDVWHAARRGARPRRSPAAVDRNLRGVRGRRRSDGLGERRRRQVFGDDARRPEGAAEGAGRDDLPAAADVHRAGGLVELHVRGGCPGGDAAAPDGRHRHHRAALFAGAVRQQPAVEARTVGAGDAADGHRAVHLEARRLVSPQAAGREPAGRQGARAGQGVADRRAGAGGVDDRQGRSASATGRERPASSPPRSSARIWTT